MSVFQRITETALEISGEYGAGRMAEPEAILAAIRAMLSQYKPGLQKQMAYHSMKHDTTKNKILQSDIYNRLNDIEKKLIQNESQIYAIQ